MLNPNNMTVIINIQNLSGVINPVTAYTFKELENKSIDELRAIQDELIPLYNEAIAEEAKRRG